MIHPGSMLTPISSIDVETSRAPGSFLRSIYRVSGDVSGLRMPPIVSQTRADDLWRHTCFEIFLRGGSGDVYYEFNLSPSTQWAAYRFSGYRQNMMPAATTSLPTIEISSQAGGFELRASLDLSGLTELGADVPWYAGLAAVMEDTSGQTSYWSLTHPAGRPDFHHADCFSLALPAP